MAKINTIIDHCVEVFVGLCLGVLVFITFVQVIGRYLFGYSFGWVEDLCVILLCWTVWPTACLVLRDNRHLQVTFIIDRFPWLYRRVVTFALRTLTLVFLSLIIYGGLEVLDAMAGFHYITMPLPSNVKYVSVPVGAALMAYYLIRVMWPGSEELPNGDI